MARPRSTRSTLTPTRATPENAPGSSATTDADESAATMATELAAMAMETGTTSLPENFCIIEGRNSVVDFADMQAGEIAQNIESRRQRVFLLMEELRRLRVQQRVKTIGLEDDETVEPREFVSVIPGFPVLTEDSVKDYRIYWGAAVAMLLLFGGLIAPMAEVKLGLGGTSYAEFIDGLHLPAQLAQVDPIVASFTGGAVGAISAFFVIEIENVKEQRKKICMYCKGSGYLQCAECSMSKRPGRLIDPTSGSRCICPTCSGTAKVMCTSCLCTGMALATEHDPRIDPFD
ncbi:unnamed product [Ostreococcus tauri]|uniref:Unnamed product n=2 Tax=Ostreococcus tauri TaxID=70448 RepID=A0A096P8L3_OSTTA|nr:unnamed product [Ostreococcus tauri]CEG00612.1 unnamed product [Ostreococcus tauri]|eukprot:XP_003083953.2 unnamed product [Ostreococcus tauri]